MQSFDSENQTAENTQPAPNPGCGFFQGGNVWFIAVVPASGAPRIERPKGTLNTQYTLYSGTYGNMEVVTLVQLDAARTVHRPDLGGQEVYIRVRRYNSYTGGTFYFGLWKPEISVNNYCTDAIELTFGQAWVMETFSSLYATADTSSNTSTRLWVLPRCRCLVHR